MILFTDVYVKLKERVLYEANRLNYIPNLLGRHLKNKLSKDIGVLIPNITNQFYPQLVLGIEHTARNRGYNVLLCNSQRDPKNEKTYLKTFFQKQTSGIIISSIIRKHDYLKQLMNHGVEVVALEQNIDLDCSKINYNYQKGGYLAAEYLVENGHRLIGFISAPLNRPSRKKVFEGFMKYFEENNIKIDKDYIIVSEIEEESFDEIYEYKNGKNLKKKLLCKSKIPTAIFCINDMTAFGVMQEMQKNDINIPNDVSIIGFDNIPTSQMVTPSLTTIDQSTYEMGSIAAEVLINSLEDKNIKNINISLEPTLIKRSSIRKLNL